jgi:hypothetical protein
MKLVFGDLKYQNGEVNDAVSRRGSFFAGNPFSSASPAADVFFYENF